ncbi:MAG TPA: ABC transporter permease, partial [Burkholderiales bacterium]
MKESSVWTLAWRRFRRDRLGFFSLIAVLAYVALVLAVAAGWLARDWQQETGVSFAPPTFLGAEAGASETVKALEAAQPVSDYGIPDPLGPDLAEIAKGLSGASPNEARAPTL